MHLSLGLDRHNLQTKIHVCDTLMNAATTDNIDIPASSPDILLDILLRQSPTDLNHEPEPLPAPPKPLLQTLRHNANLGRREVVQHYDVRARPHGGFRLLFALAFHFDLDRESAGRLCGVHGACNVAAAGPDVVVLEHRHGREVVAVGVGAADEHAVFLDEAKAGGGFARAGQNAAEVGAAEEGEEVSGSVVGVVLVWCAFARSAADLWWVSYGVPRLCRPVILRAGFLEWVSRKVPMAVEGR